jgi:hypothetical protein
MLFSDVVQPVLLVDKLLATLSTLYNGMMMDFPGMLYEIFVGIKLGTTLVAFVRLVK